MPRMKTGRKSEVIQARLHTGDPMLDRARIEAVNIWHSLLKDKKKPSDIMTTALLQLDGRQIEEFRDSDRIDNLSSELTEFKQAMESMLLDLLKSIKQADPDGLREFANREPDEDNDTEFNDEFVNNIKKAGRLTYQQRRAKDGQ